MQSFIVQSFDNNEPLCIPVYPDGYTATLNKYVFTHEDDPHIPQKGKVVLYTCSWKDYPVLRPKLEKLFSNFVTMPRDNTYNNNASLNRNNRGFLDILEDRNPGTELFIIPVHFTAGAYMVPENGIQFVTEKFFGIGNRDSRTVKLYIGYRREDMTGYFVDTYYTKTDSDNLDYEPNYSFM